MKSILIITPHIPYPLNTGGNQAQFHMIEKLRDQYNIHLLIEVSANQEDALTALKRLWPNVIFHEYKEQRNTNPLTIRLFKKIKDSLTRKLKRWETNFENDFVKRNSLIKESIAFPLSTNFIEFTNDILDKNKFDLIQVEFYGYISLAYLFDNNLNTVLVHHEPRWIRNEREMFLFRTLTPNDRYSFNAAKGFEINALNRFRTIITLSDIDKLKLQEELPNKSIYSSPPFITIPQKSKVGNDGFSQRKDLLFVGSGSHFPNKDGLFWFCKSVAPLINSKYELRVTGSWDKNTQRELIDTGLNIKFIGFIDDLSIVLANSISIVPIRIGGGVRMKIIEAAQYRSPFITTSNGVEGLDFINNSDCLIANDAKTFANAVDTLLNDFSLQSKISEMAEIKINQISTSSDSLQKRIEIYTQILG